MTTRLGIEDQRVMVATDKVCPICNTKFTYAGNKICCGPKCAKVRHQKQLEDYVKTRSENREVIVRNCDVCMKEYKAKTNQKYCSKECKKAGLERCVKNQSERRQQLKETA
jgi:hypothetical protein